MKLNLDCIREILITIEEYPNEMDLDVDSFLILMQKNNFNYAEKEVIYCCKRLYEANYINLIFDDYSDKEIIMSIGDLTFFGHEFLQKIKNDNNWSKTKRIATKIGSFSIDVISQIAVNVITQLINQQLPPM